MYKKQYSMTTDGKTSFSNIKKLSSISEVVPEQHTEDLNVK